MNKLRLIILLFFIWAVVIIIKLFYIQIFSAENYSVNQYLKTQIIKPIRGLIYDRREQPLVINESKYLVYFEPANINESEKNKVIDTVDKILKIGEATIEAKINSDKLWIPLATISLTQKKKLEKYKFSGIGFEEKQTRYYPESSLSAQLVGFVGKTTEGDDIGYFGIEGFYDQDWTGLPGLVKTERDVFNKPIIIGTQEKLKGENGRNLIMTIDKNVQYIAKNHLKSGIELYGAKSGCVIIADPSSGQILALTCLPDFDPNNYQQFSEDDFRNPAISDLFEPGSIMKPLIMAAAINEKKVKTDDKFNETGPITIGKYQISTWDDKYNGELTMNQIIEKSSNVGMVYVGRKLGNKNIYQYLQKFGFSNKTEIDLQGEVSGNLKDFQSWYPIDFATVTFGQGINVTAIQMITAFSSLINGGYMVKPYVGLAFVSQDKQVKNIKPKLKDRVINKTTSQQIKNMLQQAVEHKEANWKIPVGYKIGGKTGTAQIPIEGHYDPSKTIASFIGFAPVDHPRFIALVTLKEPTSSPWGSETAAPIFFKIASDLLVYYNVLPE